MIDEAVILNKLKETFNNIAETFADEILEKRKDDSHKKIKKLISDLLSLNTSDNDTVKQVVSMLRELLKEECDRDIDAIIESISGLLSIDAIEEIKTINEYNNKYDFSKHGKYKNMKRNEKVSHHLSRINHHLEQLRKHNPKLHKQLSSLHRM